MTRWSVSFLSGRHKKLTVPRFNNATENPVILQYQACCEEASHLSLLDFHRRYVMSVQPSHLYARNEVAIIGCKMASHKKHEFFWQHTILHIPFNTYSDFLPPHYTSISDSLQMFYIAYHNNPALWELRDAVMDYFSKRGCKENECRTTYS